MARWHTIWVNSVWIAGLSAIACSSNPDDSVVPGTGGAPGAGGHVSGTGGTSTGGSPVGAGGSASGGVATGGSVTTGGAPGVGGMASGGSTGGVVQNTGGVGEVGGGSATGGKVGAGGAATGGQMSCDLPSTFKWTSGAPFAQPKSGWDSLKDFTATMHEGKYLIYMTNHSGSSYGAAMFSFSDWAEAATASQNTLSFAAVAPTLFYFAPKDYWVLAYQWGATKFSYRTSTDPFNAASWGSEKSLYNDDISDSNTGPIDQTVICDDADCYLFFAGDNGLIYRSSMPKANFPAQFPKAETIMQETAQTLFEAVQVYKVGGSAKYLMIVEAQNGNPGRYFRSWTATSLGGTWSKLADSTSQPFAGSVNVMFTGTKWTNDISHGDIVRSNPDESFTIDPCKLEMVYQGRDPNSNVTYDKLPYRPGLLVPAR